MFRHNGYFVCFDIHHRIKTSNTFNKWEIYKITREFVDHKNDVDVNKFYRCVCRMPDSNRITTIMWKTNFFRSQFIRISTVQ